MDRAAVLSILRKHRADFEASGVAHLRLFGSVARDQATAASDVDVLVDFHPNKLITLISLGHVHTQLAQVLDTEIDLVPMKYLREPLRSSALREAVLAF